MNTLGVWLAVLGSILGIVLVVATIVAYFRTSLAKATIDTLKESNGALQEQATILKGEFAGVKARVEALERENNTLRSALSGRADASKILDRIQAHHDEVMADRIQFENRFVEAMTEVGNRLDSTKHDIKDALALLGNKREDTT